MPDIPKLEQAHLDAAHDVATAKMELDSAVKEADRANRDHDDDRRVRAARIALLASQKIFERRAAEHLEALK